MHGMLQCYPSIWGSHMIVSQKRFIVPVCLGKEASKGYFVTIGKLALTEALSGFSAQLKPHL